ncbi:MAG: hypothetical protein ACKVU0_12175 [Saprospiraceae bacterium]
MKNLALISLFCFYATVPLAQSVSGTERSVASNIKIAYNATLVYPGVRGGIEYPIKRIDLVKCWRKKLPRPIVKERFLSGEIGFYHHPTFHDNIYLLVGWQMRRTGRRGFFTEFSPALGYSRTFLGGETYSVDDLTGKVTLIKWAGYNYAMLSLGGGIGYKFRPRTSAFLRTCLLTMFPSNNYVYLRPTIELGIILKPKHFLMASPKIVSKSKGKKH